VLYRLPQIVDAVAKGEDIWIVEGEKDADRAAADGLAATTSVNGANGWRTEYGRHLQGCRVIVVSDADEPGRRHARRVANDLVENWECTVRTVESPLGKDYSEHRDRGGHPDQMVTTWQSYAEPRLRRTLTIDEMLDTEFPASREIIPGLLAEGNVLMLVGPEGHGKSTLIRQIAMQCATGMVPFSLADMEPLRVLVIDAENPEAEAQTDWRKLNWLCDRHGHPARGCALSIESVWLDPPDLLKPDGVAWAMERITVSQPHLVCMGPVYKLCDRDVRDDEAARRFMAAVGRARTVCNSAFIIEHHAPHKAPGDKDRSMRPYGSSIFLRQPDLGYGMTITDDPTVYDMTPFRGSRNRSRRMPERIRLGGGGLEFPWEDAGPAEAGKVIPLRRS